MNETAWTQEYLNWNPPTQTCHHEPIDDAWNQNIREIRSREVFICKYCGALFVTQEKK